MVLRRQIAPLAMLWLLAACGDSTPPAPQPGNGGTVTITGRERFGWDQPATTAAELATFRYAIYVDGTRSEVTEVTCAATPGTAGYACSGRLPAMNNGAHTLELATFIDAGGPIESARSGALRVTVTGVTAGTLTALSSGEIVETIDGVRLQAEMLAEELDEPSALAVSDAHRVYVATRSGLVVHENGGIAAVTPLSDGPIVSMTLSPSFDRDAHLYVTQVVPSASGETEFLTSRYRDLGDRIGQRMVVLQHGPASVQPSASVRFGPDAKLYAAFDDGGSPAAALRLSTWSGKILRMEPDGRTPPDQPAASPVLISGLTSPRGFDWSPDGAAIWVADASRDGIERLRVITTTGERPRRAGQRATFTMPRGIDAAGAAFYKGDAIREFAGDLFIAARGGEYLLRVRFGADDRSRPASTERLLEGRIGAVRAVAVARDGTIYFCSERALWKLARTTRD